MKIIYKQGDMFSHEFPKDQVWKVFAHGCNAQGVMGSGVAAQVKRLFPLAYNKYKLECSLGNVQAGGVIYAEVDNKYMGQVVILNLITQDFWGRDKNTVYVDYNAVKKCLKEVDEECSIAKEYDSSQIEVVMPKIGTGLANGDWSIIEKIIEENSNNFQPVVYVL